jgi:hypothetical protein
MPDLLGGNTMQTPFALSSPSRFDLELTEAPFMPEPIETWALDDFQDTEFALDMGDEFN